MKSIFKILTICFLLFTGLSCNTDLDDVAPAVVSIPESDPIPDPEPTPLPDPKAYSYLALGDSYTIGESVCETCRFPEQLKFGLQSAFPKDTFSLEVIARTGWTTTNLINAIDAKNLKPNYDLVTLLIGVNNQYQGRPFSLYEQEFPQLVNTAISLAKAKKTNVIVVSIPDYAYTRFGNGNTAISTQIDSYNAFAKEYCLANNITFVNITDITRLGLIETNLVASDGLHPSAVAYAKFVERILPVAKTVISQ